MISATCTFAYEVCPMGSFLIEEHFLFVYQLVHLLSKLYHGLADIDYQHGLNHLLNNKHVKMSQQSSTLCLK